MLDLTKSYVTREGHRVTNLQYVPFNSSGNKVTFPIKGSVVIKGKRSSIYRIWKEDGSESIFGESKWDLVLKD